MDNLAGKLVKAHATLEPYRVFWERPLSEDEFVPTRGCSVPTFHGSAADLAGVAAALLNLIALHLGNEPVRHPPDQPSALGCRSISPLHAAPNGQRVGIRGRLDTARTDRCDRSGLCPCSLVANRTTNEQGAALDMADASQIRTRHPRPAAGDVRPDTPIWCPACHEGHPAAAFNKETRRFSGLATICRAAQAARRQTEEGRAATKASQQGSLGERRLQSQVENSGSASEGKSSARPTSSAHDNVFRPSSMTGSRRVASTADTTTSVPSIQTI